MLRTQLLQPHPASRERLRLISECENGMRKEEIVVDAILRARFWMPVRRAQPFQSHGMLGLHSSLLFGLPGLRIAFREQIFDPLIQYGSQVLFDFLRAAFPQGH